MRDRGYDDAYLSELRRKHLHDLCERHGQNLPVLLFNARFPGIKKCGSVEPRFSFWHFRRRDFRCAVSVAAAVCMFLPMRGLPPRRYEQTSRFRRRVFRCAVSVAAAACMFLPMRGLPPRRYEQTSRFRRRVFRCAVSVAAAVCMFLPMRGLCTKKEKDAYSASFSSAPAGGNAASASASIFLSSFSSIRRCPSTVQSARDSSARPRNRCASAVFLHT